MERLRVGYVVGRLGRGGAELQLIRLASGLVARGHDVEVFAYDGSSPQDQELTEQGVALRIGAAATRRAKVQATRTWMREYRPTVVHGVMKRASSVAVLSRVAQRLPIGIVATDMSTASYGKHKPVLWGSLAIFSLADRIITQTVMNERNLGALAPWLRHKITVIRNGVDTNRFSPSPAPRPRDHVFRFCVVGTVYPVKNPVRVVQAVAELVARGRTDFRVDWFGRIQPTADDSQLSPLRLAEELGVQQQITFHGQTEAVEEVLRQADALLHVSVQEGFPNAVVEAMACGLPVIVSRVSDLPLVVGEAENGFIVDEKDPKAIADGMEHMMALGPDDLRILGERSRSFALEHYSVERFLDEYEALYRSLAVRR